MKQKQYQQLQANSLRMLIAILLLLIQQVNGFLDYTDEKMVNCSEVYTPTERNQKFKLHKIDQYVIIILAPISIISTLVIIVIFLKYKQSRKQPSDIIFCISFSDLILSIHWLSQAIYAQITDSVPADDSLFCQVNSFFSCISGSSQYLYNILFCAFLITRIRNSIKGFRIKKSIIHIFTISGSLAFYLYLKIQSKTELNIYGMCSYQVDNISWIMGVCVCCFYIILSWFTIFYFKRYVPNNNVFREQRSRFLRFYYYYILTLGISWSILAISNTLVGLNCTYEIEPFLNIFITIGNITKLITPIILSLVRYSDPTLQESIIHSKSQNPISTELINLSSLSHFANKSSIDSSHPSEFDVLLFISLIYFLFVNYSTPQNQKMKIQSKI